jgi:hypothetical protein
MPNPPGARQRQLDDGSSSFLLALPRLTSAAFKVGGKTVPQAMRTVTQRQACLSAGAVEDILGPRDREEGNLVHRSNGVPLRALGAFPRRDLDSQRVLSLFQIVTNPPSEPQNLFQKREVDRGVNASPNLLKRLT